MMHVHLIGIGGSGLSAIAHLLLERGYRVSGSDRQLTPQVEQLRNAGVQVFIGHRSENLAGADLVLRSSAISDENVEVQAALASGIPVLKRADFLGDLMADRFGIAIAGTHGKTTTTAMISWMLTALRKDPSFIIGGVSTNLSTNAHAGKGQFFVIEADEYDYMFLGLRPRLAIITSVEHDHPDCFPTPQDFYRAFVDFVHRLPLDGIIIACSDEPGAARLLKDAWNMGYSGYSYGLGAEGNSQSYLAINLRTDKVGNYQFDAYYSGKPLATAALRVPGEHNVRNALAALAVAHRLNLPMNEAAQALSSFSGTGRRFEVRGDFAGITVIDDYAHHPTEIRATLAAAPSRFPGRRIWAVWQPHTYSRTMTLFQDFSQAFHDADHVIVTEVYPAREPYNPEFSASSIVQAMQHMDAVFIPGLDQALDHLKEHLNAGDVLIILSAGDADQISTRLIEMASQNRSGEYVQR